MTTTHYRDQSGSPVGIADATSRAELSVAIIGSTNERRLIVDIYPNSVSCRNRGCSSDCKHERKIRAMLAEYGLEGDDHE